jgi:hypothetical protein
LSAGCFVGGFLIDVDHYFDYLFIEKQYRKPWPAAFLRHYFENRFTRIVLPLHSWELFAVLIALSFWLQSMALNGYLVGALTHLVCDILINGEHSLRQPVLFYSFAYRAQRGFSASELIEISGPPTVQTLGGQFWSVHPSPKIRRHKP